MRRVARVGCSGLHDRCLGVSALNASTSNCALLSIALCVPDWIPTACVSCSASVMVAQLSTAAGYVLSMLTLAHLRADFSRSLQEGAATGKELGCNMACGTSKV